MKRLLLSVALGLFPAFAGAADGNAGSTFRGEYMVPVPTALAQYGTFDTQYCLSKDTDGREILSYHLPEEVVGLNAPEIRLKETAKSNGGLVQYEGTHGVGSCRKKAGRLTCFILYPSYDTSGAKAFLQSKYSGAELEGRLQIADLFSADPKGVLTFVRTAPLD